MPHPATHAATAALAAAFALAAGQAAAVTVTDCNTPSANARNLHQPFDEATRTFANGAVSFLYLQQDEPACCGSALMVLFPTPDEPFQSCRIVTTDDGMGFWSLDLAAATAAYDPARGLTLAVPAARHDGAQPIRLTLDVTVNQGTGRVTAGTASP